MLNGIAPIIIYTFPVDITDPTFNALSGIPEKALSYIKSFGLPIPLYLDEQLTGIYVDSETRAIDLETSSQPTADGKQVVVDQKGLNSIVTINMFARKDSVLLAVLLALNDIAFQKSVQGDYSITYLNGVTTVFGGLLHSFSTSVGVDDDRIQITLQLSKANQLNTLPQSAITLLPAFIGSLPNLGV